MSLSASLSNALSGLTASSRAAQLVSNNVSNVMTEGYGKREIALSARVVGGGGAGVQVDGVVRVVDQGLLRDRRLADAALGYSETTAGFLESLSDLVGTPEKEQSLSGRLRLLEESLITAASRPDSDTRLANVLSAAQELAGKINAASDGIQAARLEADRSIAVQVNRLNAGLEQVQELNASIASLNGRGRDVSALEDQRQKVIDSLSQIVPLREVPREDGKVMLYTQGGAILLDDTAATIGFTPANFITPDMTLDSGALSGLSINGRPIATEGSFQPLGGGTLGGALDVRDRLAVEAQSDLDALARDLVERLQDPAVDPTTAPGDAGLFTDGGATFAAADEPGLAGRIAVNPGVDPQRGGALRLLRDGLGATVAGDIGNASQLSAFADALTARRTAASGPNAGTDQTAHTMVSALTSRITGDLLTAERQAGFAAAEQQSLKDLEQATGVDTDEEMQKLLLIEQAYAANARVIQTIDKLLQDLLAI
jgi:flagellar hook-associated protein 1